MKALDVAKPVNPGRRVRPSWRQQLDHKMDQWMSSPGFYRWAIGNPLTRWVTRRRAAQLFQLMAGFVHSQVLLACVRLKLFEWLREQPMTLEQLAQHSRMSHAAMQRLLQSAVALRLLEYRDNQAYGLGPLGAPVAADVGLQLMIEHNAVLFDDMRDPLALLRDEMQPHMQAYWPYMNGDNTQAWEAEKVARYSELMSASQRFVIEEMLASYDFTAHRQVLDIGGGKGGWVMALAQQVPALRLHLMDLPPVAALAAQRMDQAGLSQRVTVHGGSFISDALPTGCDLVTLVRVAHDHPDAVVKALLAKIYLALPRGGRLLLAEPMAQPPGQPAVADAYFHFYLLAMGCGRLRGLQELRALMLEAGFDAVEPVNNPMPLHTQLLLGQKN